MRCRLRDDWISDKDLRGRDRGGLTDFGRLVFGVPDHDIPNELVEDMAREIERAERLQGQGDGPAVRASGILCTCVPTSVRNLRENEDLDAPLLR